LSRTSGDDHLQRKSVEAFGEKVIIYRKGQIFKILLSHMKWVACYSSYAITTRINLRICYPNKLKYKGKGERSRLFRDHD